MIKLLKRKISLWLRLKKSSKRLFLAEQYLSKVKSKHSRLKLEYERVDRELAMTDGRYKVITLEKKEKDPVKNLTIEQINKIAKALGIELKEEK